MFRTPEPVMRWWHANEGYLVERTPVASVGLVWSQRNTDFFGRDDPGRRVDAPYTGFMHALVRAHARDVEAGLAELDSGVGMTLADFEREMDAFMAQLPARG